MNRSLRNGACRNDSHCFGFRSALYIVVSLRCVRTEVRWKLAASTHQRCPIRYGRQSKWIGRSNPALLAQQPSNCDELSTLDIIAVASRVQPYKRNRSLSSTYDLELGSTFGSQRGLAGRSIGAVVISVSDSPPNLRLKNKAHR